MAEGIIFNIQKFCVNDGPGIRTTVFLKGCPLNCLWCHNPESKSAAPELYYDPQKCVLCHRCESRCVAGNHRFQEQVHSLERKNCAACGWCAANCPTGALETVGYLISPSDALKEVLTDRIFYENSGGGLTLSGGEPMHQFEFSFELLKLAKEAGLHTCMETCGFANSRQFREIAEYVDIFLFDYKETDPEKHKEFTGVSNEVILKNLAMLDEMGCATILRCPVIPGCNDRADHFAGIAAAANGLKHILQVEIEPYHPLGKEKNVLLGREYVLGELSFPEESTVQSWIGQIAAQTNLPVYKG